MPKTFSRFTTAGNHFLPAGEEYYANYYYTFICRPDDGGIDLRSIDVDDRERRVDGELAQHRQTDRQPRQIGARLCSKQGI